MFSFSSAPRVFAMPPGADFARLLVDGLNERAKRMPPEQFAKVQIYVNTARMQRRLREVFDGGEPRLLPRIRLITDIALDAEEPDVRSPVSPMRRRLELSQLVAGLLDQERDLAPRAALYDLSDSLAQLMDEMQGEGVVPDAISSLDVSDESGHWQRAQKFLEIIRPFFDSALSSPDRESRQRRVIEARVAAWENAPPKTPIIVAGSTGSRGATSLFMQAVARLPQGALVLPGFDYDMPAELWPVLDDGTHQAIQDHPQYRFHDLLNQLGLSSLNVARWQDIAAPDAARNALVSLSLRPAPVTSQWLNEGPKLGDLVLATSGITLVEANSPRVEAEAIALRLRQAAQDGVTAALISPDRMLTRQVTAALDRWQIIPDDSAGLPLAQSAPGRLLRHVADLLGRQLTAETLLVLLKHPLTNSETGDRGLHLLFTREFELWLRRQGAAFLNETTLNGWLRDDASPERQLWVKWISGWIAEIPRPRTAPLSDWLELHLVMAEMICAGPLAGNSGGLWDTAAGREARRVCDLLSRDADAGGIMATRDYATMFQAIIAQGVVRDRDIGHPGILIWGTLEARVQGAELVILGGMNDGIWPEAPSPDPWLNRAMRKATGMLMPERQIGLSAHDYQQAVAAKEVWITRSKRSADAETVPSRWINRLTNLLTGLPTQHGPEALRQMHQRGQRWLQQAEMLSQPVCNVDRAERPSPQPPIAARPKKLSVTRVKTLIRDPYAIYADLILRLRPLDPLVAAAEVRLRGVIYHKIMEDFILSRPDATAPGATTALLEIARQRLDELCPWPTVRLQWLTRMERIAPIFLAQEADRQSVGDLAGVELKGALLARGPDVTLTCKADRIDLTQDGAARIYDYKTGVLPSGPVQEKFDKQLLLEAAMVTQGAFDAIGRRPVAAAAFLGLNNDMKISDAPLAENPPDEVWDDFIKLMSAWQQQTQGYTARMAHFKKGDPGYYDHLSRFGEWDMSTKATPVVLT